MTSFRIESGRYVLPAHWRFFLRDVAIKSFYFALVATAFLFVIILVTGVHG